MIEEATNEFLVGFLEGGRWVEGGSASSWRALSAGEGKGVGRGLQCSRP